MIRIIPFVLYLFLLAMHQVIWKDLTGMFGAAINLAAMMVILVAIYRTEMTAVWFGFVAGLVTVAGMPGSMGWQALTLAAIGLAAFHMRERLNLDSLNAKLLLVLGGVLVHNLLTLIIVGTDAFWYRLVVNALTGAVYTTVVAWLFFLFKEKRVTVRKIRSIF
jgi:rod shape-determining protein MreD